MATDEDPEAPGSRLALLIGLVIAGLASTAAFGRVFRGTDVTVRLCVLSLAATGLAALMVRRGVLLATATSAAALLVAIGLIVFPNTTRYFLPTLSTMRAIGSALGHVGRDANVTPAPAPPVDSLILAGVTAVWTAAFAAHSLAFRARSPLLALTPLAALLAFTGIILDEGARPGYVLVFMLGALLILFGDAVRRVGQWGPISAWHGRRRLLTRSRTTARGAWRVAAGTLGIALFLPWLLPGFGGGPLLRLDQGQQRGFSLDPIDDIRTRLVTNPDVVAFTVQADHASYWRTNTLDTFDGTTWSASDGLYTDSYPVVDGAIPRPSGSSLAAGSDLVLVHARIHFQGLIQPWVPVAADPVRLSLSDGTLRYDPATGTVISSDYTRTGIDLTALSVVVVPTPAELNVFSDISSPGDPNVALPSGGATDAIRRLAQRWTAGATTSYQKIMAIQTRLKSWVYDLHVGRSITNDALLRFLTITHRGYCQQYAGAMAVLLRTLDIPTRVAVGFTAGRYDPRANIWRVTMADAHSWVEVRFPGYGWLTFDPTPTKANPVIATYDAPAAAIGANRYLDSGDPGTTGGRVPGRPGGFDPGAAERRLGQPKSFLNHGFRPPASAVTDRTPLVLGVLGALILAALILIPLMKFGRRRWSRRPGRGAAGRVLAAYTGLLDTAADVGLGRVPSETLEEYRARLSRTVPFQNGDFDALSALAERAAYAGGPTEPAAGERATELARRAATQVRRSAGAWRSVVGAYRRAPADGADRL
jgi:transglutaminase-like putative cysteine protease